MGNVEFVEVENIIKEEKKRVFKFLIGYSIWIYKCINIFVFIKIERINNGKCNFM